MITLVHAIWISALNKQYMKMTNSLFTCQDGIVSNFDLLPIQYHHFFIFMSLIRNRYENTLKFTQYLLLILTYLLQLPIFSFFMFHIFKINLWASGKLKNLRLISFKYIINFLNPDIFLWCFCYTTFLFFKFYLVMTLVHYLLLIGFLIFLKCLFSLMIKK